MPKVILTNPPFAGQGDSRITDAQVLSQFETARRFTTADGVAHLMDERIGQQGPELLFFERCLEWLAEGGRMGIILPKSFLDTTQALVARQLLFENAYVDAIVTLHKDSFQPDTGVRTCIIFVTKKTKEECKLPDSDYDIFMAVSQKVGQTSEGVPIFKIADDGSPTNEIDHDLDEIAQDFHAARAGTLTPSQFRYIVKRSEIANRLNINPQFYSPHLNESIAQVRRFDDLRQWSVTTLGQLMPGVSIFKGPRLKTENVIVPTLDTGQDVVGYFTPSAMLQDKRDSAKFIDLDKANEKQLRDFDTVMVHAGDLLLTRSGSIGRLAYVSRLMDGQIVSDDMIRVRVPSEKVRSYVAAFLLSDNAHDQMMMNEYGAIQQHLEPVHVRNLLIPVPEDWADAKDLIDAGRAFISAKEASDIAMQQVRERGFDVGMHKLLNHGKKGERGS